MHIVIDSVPSAETNWVDVLSASLVPVIAIVGVYIAYQQFQLNKQRLRHETYERRLNVYKVVQYFLSEIMREGRTTYDKVLQFNSDASEAAFLFDDSVQNKIDEIFKKSLDMVGTHEKLYPSSGSAGLPVGDERSKVADEEKELLLWLVDELKNSRSFFAEKLGLNVS